MELDYGMGKIVWSQLDLEDHASLDPTAQRLAKQVVNHAIKAPLAPRATVNYIGSQAGSAILKSLGLQFKSVMDLPTSGVVVVGADATIGDAQLENFARRGGKGLFLARQKTVGAASLRLQERTDFVGSLQTPVWPEARGLSASDLRWRNASRAWLAAPGNGWEMERIHSLAPDAGVNPSPCKHGWGFRDGLAHLYSTTSGKRGHPNAGR
jgi:beta-galactosidase